MTDLELDRVMQRVLLDALRNDEADGGGGEGFFAPTKHHLRQMQRMLQNPLKWLRDRSKPLWKVVVQKVAIILLIVSLSFGGVMIVSPAARAAVKRWVLEVSETMIVYRFFAEDISGAMPQYGITDLPDGYVETERIVNSASVSILYVLDTGDLVTLDYVYMQEGVLGVFAPGDDTILPVTIGDFDGQAFVPQKSTSAKTIIWIDPTANIQFMLKGFGEFEDILHMANSVSLVDAIH